MCDRVVAVIPARGGSKGLPRKNILNLAGKPLIAWTIEDAKSCSLVNRVIVSTDDEKIAKIAKDYGADIPFIRPPELSQDTTTSEEVLLHAIEWLKAHEGQMYDVLLYLQATDPFRNDDIICKVLKTLLANPDLDTVFAAYPEHKNYWISKGGQFLRLDDRGHKPRQTKEQIYREDTGIACATRIKVIMSGQRIGNRVMVIPHETKGSFIDIHTEFDLWLANIVATRVDRFNKKQ